jgi:hypothetical protein
MTITEALAEIKTIDKRISSKQEMISTFLFRLDQVRDPHEKDGGSTSVIDKEMQAIKDLEQRKVDIRIAIQKANEETKVSIEGREMSIADWLVWRREVAPNRERFLYTLQASLRQARDAMRRGAFGQVSSGEKTDLVVNIDEKSLADEVEKMKNILGQLDGQLSLKNATVMLNI